MKYYVVVGQDQIYSGMYGMLEVAVITANDFEEALIYAEELSYSVIESYSQIYNEIERDVEDECIFRGVFYTDDDDKVNEIRDEIIANDLDCYVEELNEKLLPSLDLEVLNNLITEDDWENFVKKYGLKK